MFIAIKMFEEGDAETWEELLKTIENIELGDRKDEMVTYVQWEMVVKEVLEDEDNFNKENGKKRPAKKEPKKRLKSIKVKDLAKRCAEGFNDLKDHLHRNRVMKAAIAGKKEAVLEDQSETSALVWVDWSQGMVLRQDREIQNAWFGASSLSLQSGFIFRKNRSQGFGSFSEGADHKVFSSCILGANLFLLYPG